MFRQLIDQQNQDLADLEQVLRETQSRPDQDEVGVLTMIIDLQALSSKVLVIKNIY